MFLQPVLRPDDDGQRYNHPFRQQVEQRVNAVAACRLSGTIRNDRFIPVQRVMQPSEKYLTTTPDGRTITRSRRGKTDYYRITTDELALYRVNRPQQITRMTEQRANRRRRDLAARVITELSRAGEAANIPPVFREWASLAVPAPGVGTSASSIEISIQEKPVCKQQ